MPVDVQWVDGTNRVIVSNTFLPIEALGRSDPSKSITYPAIIEYDLVSRKFRKIATFGQGTSSVLGLVADGFVEMLGPQGEPSRCYQRSGVKWTQAACGDRVKVKRLALSVNESLNSSPELEVLDVHTQRRRVVTDLNPKFEALIFGNATVIELSVPSGGRRKEGLVFPPNYVSTRRYPLVIQVYAFDPNEFIIDGPYHIPSPYAAQALAGRDMLVLQVGVVPRQPDKDPLETQRAFLDSIIEELDGKGLIDPKKVGLIGFSATGSVVIDHIVFSNRSVAAAMVVDAVHGSLFSYVVHYLGDLPPGMLVLEQKFGGQPWGSSLPKWIEKDPSFHTDRIQAALRLQHHGRYVYPQWDIYALMRRQRKPVELVTFPRASHWLTNPHQRFESLEGTVDWFDFWLNDREDPASKKTEQYERWRSMRDGNCCEKGS